MTDRIITTFGRNNKKLLRDYKTIYMDSMLKILNKLKLF